MTTRLSSARPAFLRGERGAITLEYVLWLPGMMLWTVGFVTLTTGQTLQNETAKAHYAVTDVVSRFETMDSGDAEDLYDLYRALTQTIATGERFRITQVELIEHNGEETHIVNWSCAFPPVDFSERDDYPLAGVPGAMAPLDHDDIPVGLIPTMLVGQHNLLVQSVSPYQPAFNLGYVGARDMEFDTVVRPRRVSSVDLTDAGTACLVPAPPT